jgi:guanine deaminase
MNDTQKQWMKAAVALSIEGMQKGKGGPFGAIVVKDGQIIGKGFNSVIDTNDPTAHAEVVAIRDACNHLGSFDLAGCEVYTSCEPCPMCLGAIYWARPDAVYYANTKKDAAAINFDDDFIYEEIAKPLQDRKIPFIKIEEPEAIKAFEIWSEKEDKTLY